MEAQTVAVSTTACNYPLLAIRRSSVAPDDERPRSGRESRIAIVHRPEAPAGGGLFLNGNDLLCTCLRSVYIRE